LTFTTEHEDRTVAILILEGCGVRTNQPASPILGIYTRIDALPDADLFARAVRVALASPYWKGSES
jgi:hypothetical protein